MVLWVCWNGREKRVARLSDTETGQNQNEMNLKSCILKRHVWLTWTSKQIGGVFHSWITRKQTEINATQTARKYCSVPKWDSTVEPSPFFGSLLAATTPVISIKVPRTLNYYWHILRLSNSQLFHHCRCTYAMLTLNEEIISGLHQRNRSLQASNMVDPAVSWAWIYASGKKHSRTQSKKCIWNVSMDRKEIFFCLSVAFRKKTVLRDNVNLSWWSESEPSRVSPIINNRSVITK